MLRMSDIKDNLCLHTTFLLHETLCSIPVRRFETSISSKYAWSQSRVFTDSDMRRTRRTNRSSSNIFVPEWYLIQVFNTASETLVSFGSKCIMCEALTSSTELRTGSPTETWVPKKIQEPGGRRTICHLHYHTTVASIHFSSSSFSLLRAIAATPCLEHRERSSSW